MKQFFVLSALFPLLLPAASAPQPAQLQPVSNAPIYVAYPPEDHRLSHDRVLLEGSVWAGGTLRVNGQMVAVGPDGLFVLWWPLDMGRNTLKLETQRGGAYSRHSINVYRVPASARAEVYEPITPRTVQVKEVFDGVGLNSVHDVWQTDDELPVLYARKGVRGVQVGRRGIYAHLQLPDGRRVWTRESRLAPVRGPLGAAHVGRPRLVLADLRAEEIRLPVTARVPFEVVEAQGSHSLQLRLLGASNVLGTAPQHTPKLTLRQTQEGNVHVLGVELARPLHGYTATYEAGELGDELVLRLRLAPTGGSLQGRVIVLDAGHGGAEDGGAGPLRSPEKHVVLPITLRAAELLRERGAEVWLTRTHDEDVDIYDRPRLAAKAEADALLSIHANAIPDGVDPRTRRGTSVYFTHEFARPLAAAVYGSVREQVPELGDDRLRAGADLALTRPTNQPSVLLEMGYMTDPSNLRLMMSAQGRERLAHAIADGLEAYFAGLPE